MGLEDETEDGELNQHGYTHDKDWGYQFMNTYEKQQIQEDDMQAKVDGMATREPEEALDGGLCPKSKGASQEVVNNETDQIAYYIGDIGSCPEKQ